MKSLIQPLISREDQQRLDDLYAVVEEESQKFIGYPCNNQFDYSPLYRFLRYPLNNVGDPFLPSNYHLNSHQFETEVLSLYSQLVHAPENATWGYVTNGGTEGNMYGLFLARELYPDGVVYYSEDTHYSVDKILRCLKIRSIMIRSLPDGRMDLNDLRETLKIYRDVPPIIFANIGTTMKGAIDDLEGINQIFQDLALPRHYIHGDAALSGMILPFVESPPPWDFQAGIDSISVSGHKLIGSPIPCGMVLANKRHVDRIAQSVEYIGTLDTTLSGSRNGITPLFLWYAFKMIKTEGFKQRIQHCFVIADYAIKRLNEMGHNAWRHDDSITVVFDRPPLEIAQKWQLAVHKKIAHLIAMPHLTHRQIDQFIGDLIAAEKPVASAVTCQIVPHKLLDTDKVSTHQPAITLICPPQLDILSQISEAMASEGINIESFEATSVEEMEIIRMEVDHYAHALQVLAQNAAHGRLYGQPSITQPNEALQRLSQIPFHSISSEAILVQLDDRPGTLAQLTKRIADAHILPRSLRITHRDIDKAIVAIATDYPQQTRKILQDILIQP